ncbi:MAG: DUF2171 domain-containing protein [Chloroflexota bacterium]|nr:DUF2171 domain-containing protein [Chloroflexota bacterium]
MSYPNDPMDQVLEGMEVYSADGQRLGDVGGVGVGLFKVESGGQTVAEERAYLHLRRQAEPDLYLPGTVIDHVTSERVILRLEDDPRQLELYTTGPIPQDPEANPGERDLTTTLL